MTLVFISFFVISHGHHWGQDVRPDKSLLWSCKTVLVLLGLGIWCWENDFLSTESIRWWKIVFSLFLFTVFFSQSSAVASEGVYVPVLSPQCSCNVASEGTLAVGEGALPSRLAVTNPQEHFIICVLLLHITSVVTLTLSLTLKVIGNWEGQSSSGNKEMKICLICGQYKVTSKKLFLAFHSRSSKNRDEKCIYILDLLYFKLSITYDFWGDHRSVIYVVCPASLYIYR